MGRKHMVKFGSVGSFFGSVFSVVNASATEPRLEKIGAKSDDEAPFTIHIIESFLLLSAHEF